MTERPRRKAPLWLMGLSNATFGLFAGYIVLPLPQLLAAHHVPEAKIAAVGAACLSPGFWVFLLGPMLDVRFSRRAYATFFAGLAGVALTASLLMQARLLVMEGLLIAGYAAAVISSNALGGWLADIVEREHEASLSAWTQVGNFLGNGLMALLPAELLRLLPGPVAAVLLGGLVMLPAAIFLWMPAPGPDRRLARESARVFFGEVLTLVKQRQVLLTLLLFAAPLGAFSLTNLLGGLGPDFHAPEQFVSRVGGLVLTLAGVAGALVLPVLARFFRLLPAYFGIGAAGGVFTLALLWLPRTPVTFGLAFLGENVFQALSFTAAVAICFEVIGRRNPLAATQFGLLTSATVLPILYMNVVDGRAYAWRGLTGALVVDCGITLVSCAVVAAIVWAVGGIGGAGRIEPAAEPGPLA